MNKELVKQDYETMYKQKAKENEYLCMELEEQGKRYGNKIYELENELKKYEKENKWLKDIINSILHI